MICYKLPGNKGYQERIYPNPLHLDPATKLKSFEDVIRHFTESSLNADGILIQKGSLQITKAAEDAGYVVTFDPLPDFASQAQQFAAMHVKMLDEKHAGLALAGADACERTPAWNPMAGYPVNSHDGNSEWLPCLPLGMPIANHRAVTLLHYPPIVAYRNADYLKNNTLQRWEQLLRCVGMKQPERYYAILDVNPIAAPGSGESEYENDYFPINLTSLFFDNDSLGLTYVRSMLELMLNPPYTREFKYTLPLLVCGSRLYDPQAPGWFRVRYKDCLLSKNQYGTPTVDVLQVGLLRIFPNSPKETPYMIANHMIAAGVTGRCTGDATSLPDIRLYEAQDLVAAMFLSLYEGGKNITPADALELACKRWFGGPDGKRAPNPSDPEDRLTICAMAQMDLCFDATKRAPKYSFEEAKTRCREKGGTNYCPCFGCD